MGQDVTLPGGRPRPAFFSVRYTRILDDLGYLTLQRFRLYAEEGLAGTEVVVWMAEDALSVEYGGEALSATRSSATPQPA